MSAALGLKQYWTHKEYDSEGNFIARYESWSITGLRKNRHDKGFIKYSPAGAKLELKK